MPEAIADKKEQIHRVACRLFRERGFHGASVRDIAEEVGLVGGSLYAHIESKDDLLWEIVDSAADRFFDALKPIVEANLAIVQKLRTAMIAHVAVIARDLDAAAVYTVEWRHLEPKRREIFTRRRDDYEAMFRRLAREAMQQGFIATADEAMATRFILSSLNYLFTWYRPDGRMTPDEVGRMMSDYILDGLKRRTA